MIINFGKHRGKDIKEIPLGYLQWGAENLSQPSLKAEFRSELQRRENPVTNKSYDPLIFGKDFTENIVNITYNNELMYLYTSDGKEDVIDYKPWVLSKDIPTGKKYTKLKGKQYYKYLTDLDGYYYKDVIERRPRGVWFPRSIEEGFMMRHGFTYFKGMKVTDISVLSFDIEATSLDPDDPNAEVILISNTFRNNKGKIIKKLFDIFEYDNQQDMIREWCLWVQKVNPDILIGHNILSYDLPYIASQDQDVILDRGSEKDHIRFDERKSKFRKDGSQQYDYFNARIHGRDIIDTFFLSMKYDIGRNFPSYGLKQIEEYLGLVDENRVQWDFSKYPTRKYKEWPEGKWEEFKQYCMDDGDSPLKMFDIMIPPFFYLCQSIPKTLQQINNEASGSQLDSIMIRSYLQDGFSQPMTSQKVEYEGAISMGIPGTYENVRKVDVASLYPSIMLQYDIYDRSKDPQGNMIKALRYFRDERLKNKKLAKETGEQHYDDMQAAQKIMINSMYGFLGAGFLLYNYPKGAADVTKHGREILQKGVSWATGHELKKVVKKIVNEGKPNEKKYYEWVVGERVEDGKGYNLVNVDTDSFSITNGVAPTHEEFIEEIEDLNSIYPDLIKWEDDGVFDQVIVVKAKNYVLKQGNKIKYKGSSLTDQKKEPILIGLLERIINCLLSKDDDLIPEIYRQHCLEALNPMDIKEWCVKKTITKSVLNPERPQEEKILNACDEAIKKGLTDGIQEGDKVYLYQAEAGEKQKVAKGEPVFLKSGKPSMVKNTELRYPELYNNDHDKWHYVERVYKTAAILENVINLDELEKYHLKSKRKLLESL